MGKYHPTFSFQVTQPSLPWQLEHWRMMLKRCWEGSERVNRRSTLQTHPRLSGIPSRSTEIDSRIFAIKDSYHLESI